jgi:type III secretory pathway component EscV
MKLLVAERVSLRNVREIAEALVAWAPREKETVALAEQVRVALGAQICQEFACDRVLHAWLLERALEERLGAALQQTPIGTVIAIDHDVMQTLVTRLRALAATRAETRVVPIVLTTQVLRRPLRQLLADELFNTHVLSYAELSPTQRVQVLGTVSLEEQSSATQ